LRDDIPHSDDTVVLCYTHHQREEEAGHGVDDRLIMHRRLRLRVRALAAASDAAGGVGHVTRALVGHDMAPLVRTRQCLAGLSLLGTDALDRRRRPLPIPPQNHVTAPYQKLKRRQQQQPSLQLTEGANY